MILNSTQVGALLCALAVPPAMGAATEPPPEAKVRVVVDADGAATYLTPGDTFQMKLSVYNDGPAAADKITTRVTAPKGTVVADYHGAWRNYCTATQTDVTCTPPRPAPGDGSYSDWITVDLKAAPKAKPATLTVTATATATVKGVESQPVTAEQRWTLEKAPVYRAPAERAFPQKRTLRWSPLPSSKAEQDRLGRWMMLPDHRPTGYLVNAGDRLAVDVRRTEPGDPLPELVIGNHGMRNPDHELQDLPEPRTYKLKPGRTTVTDPRGGIINLRYVDDRPAKQQHKATVTLGRTAHPIPYYVLGKTTHQQWQTMLKAATAPYVQLQGRHVQLAVLRDTARQQATASQDELLKTYDTVAEQEDRISGLRGKGQPAGSPLLQQIVEFRNGYTANATDYRVAWPSSWGSEELLTAKGLKHSWGLWHEMGHQRQMSKWTWRPMTEQTVNIYSLAAMRAFGADPKDTGHAGPAEWQLALKYLDLPDGQRDFDAAGSATGTGSLQSSEYHFGRFAMFEQLRVLFGDAFYHRLHAAARPAAEDSAGDDAARKRFFMVEASKAARRDLTAYFTAWGLRPTDDVRKEIAALELPEQPEESSRTPVYGRR
ncbi:M60 family metallopeptidase [Streptomyces sp. NPDC059009]|uniref:M60 family metallopeptidase n=1 Tax=Streptomyces sp. NPDC059009 TaxID=3346694 RepID=UPI003680AE0E